MVENGAQKYLSCKHAVSYMGWYLDGDGSVVDGYNQDYSCKNPDIFKSAIQKRLPVESYADESGEVVLEAVPFWYRGDINDSGVKRALEEWCADCPFFESRKS